MLNNFRLRKWPHVLLRIASLLSVTTIAALVPIFESSATLLKDINAGENGSASTYSGFGFVQLGERLIFAAIEPQHGIELWSTDGSELGTQLVKDLVPGPNYSSVSSFWTPTDSGSPKEFTELSGAVYFTVSDSGYEFDAGRELWRSDGTPGGTYQVIDINPEDTNANSGVSNLTVANELLYFSAHRYGTGSEVGSGTFHTLWVTDGTDVGTLRLTEMTPQYLTEYRDQMFFAASRADREGLDLWSSDGSLSGTAQIFELPGFGIEESAYDEDIRVAGEYLYFPAYGYDGELHIWVTDGSVAGTRVLPQPLLKAGIRHNFTPVGDQLFFQAASPNDELILWVTDGSLEGTRQVGVLPSACGTYPWLGIGTTLFFTADAGDHQGCELWKSDGTASGTRLVKDIFPGIISSYPQNFADIRGLLVFSADGDETGEELWRSDGTEAGTYMVSDISPGRYSGSSPAEFRIFKQSLIFAAQDDVYGREPRIMELSSLNMPQQPLSTPSPDQPESAPSSTGHSEGNAATTSSAGSGSLQGIMLMSLFTVLLMRLRRKYTVYCRCVLPSILAGWMLLAGGAQAFELPGAVNIPDMQKKGRKIVGGGVGLDISSDQRAISVGPYLLYFYSDKIALGGQLLTGYTDYEFGDVFIFEVSPTVRYYFDRNLYGIGQLSYRRSDTRANAGGSTVRDENSDLGAAGGVGYEIPLTRNVVINGEALLVIFNETTTLDTEIGFSIYLDTIFGF